MKVAIDNDTPTTSELAQVLAIVLSDLVYELTPDDRVAEDALGRLGRGLQALSANIESPRLGSIIGMVADEVADLETSDLDAF